MGADSVTVVVRGGVAGGAGAGGVAGEVCARWVGGEAWLSVEKRTRDRGGRGGEVGWFW